jgi:hypothetical protein
VRLLKLILIALLVVVALLASVFIGAIVMVASIALLLFRRWRSRRQVARELPLPRAGVTKTRPARPRNMDVIDVTATEVRSIPPP